MPGTLSIVSRLGEVCEIPCQPSLHGFLAIREAKSLPGVCLDHRKRSGDLQKQRVGVPQDPYVCSFC